MKIYFTDIKSENLDKLNKLNNNYYIEISEYLLIFSLDGIYKVNKNSNVFYKLKILDDIVIHNTIDEWNILIDNSITEYEEELSQIPYNSYTKKFIQITYSIRKNALVKFVILKDNNNKISDFYFLFNGDIGDFLFREEILTFLSIIK
jgi:hypothetical protein